MTQWLSEDQLQVQKLTRSVARGRVVARAREIDRTAEYPLDMFEMLCTLIFLYCPFLRKTAHEQDVVGLCRGRRIAG